MLLNYVALKKIFLSHAIYTVYPADCYFDLLICILFPKVLSSWLFLMCVVLMLATADWTRL